MKMKILSIVFIMSTLFLSFSCEKNADNVNLPDYTPKLVLHSFISPSDTVLVVNVGTTTNVYGKQPAVQPSLPVMVQLIDGEKVIPFGNRNEAGNCSLKYTIEAGKVYKILAKCPGYPDASGTCKVPEIKNIDLTVDTLTVTGKYDQWTYQNSLIKVKFTDIPNEVNYYGIYEVEKVRGGSDPIWEESIPLYVDGKNNPELKNKNVISDNLIDGTVISTTFMCSDGFDVSFSYLISMELETNVLLTDADYYKYHISLSKYNASDDPFTEFSPVYSNIQGGYGIFCSYIKYQKTLKLK